MWKIPWKKQRPPPTSEIYRVWYQLWRSNSAGSFHWFRGYICFLAAQRIMKSKYVVRCSCGVVAWLALDLVNFSASQHAAESTLCFSFSCTRHAHRALTIIIRERDENLLKIASDKLNFIRIKTYFAQLMTFYVNIFGFSLEYENFTRNENEGIFFYLKPSIISEFRLYRHANFFSITATLAQ